MGVKLVGGRLFYWNIYACTLIPVLFQEEASLGGIFSTVTPATNYDIFDIPLECLTFMQTTIMQALPLILLPALEACEKNLETPSALFIGSTLSPSLWPAPLPT